MNRNIILNSAMMFTIAATLHTILHEKGHFILAWVYHAPNLSLHHNYVQYDSELLSMRQRIFIAGAGPLVSLLIGILFYGAIKRYHRPDLFRLFLVYMCAFGWIGFLGYLLITPFFTYGDTGFICKALGCPTYTTIGISVFSLFLLRLAVKKINAEFVPFLTREAYENDKVRKSFFNACIHVPLYIGIIMTALLSLPVPTALSLIAPICSPLSILWTFPLLMWKKYTYPTEARLPGHIDQLSLPWILVFVLMVIINRILVGGIAV